MSLTTSVYSAARVVHMLPRGSRSPGQLPRPSPASTRPLHAHMAPNSQQMLILRPGPHRKGRRGGASSAARSPRRGDTLELLSISTTLYNEEVMALTWPWSYIKNRDIQVRGAHSVIKPTKFEISLTGTAGCTRLKTFLRQCPWAGELTWSDQR